MTIASDLFRTVIVKINDISQQLPYIVVNQADDNGKIIRFVPMDHGQKVTGFTGARLYYPPRSDDQYGDYVTGVEADGAWDFTIPVGVLSVGRVECNLAFIDGNGETYSRNVVFLVEPAVSGVFDPEDGQQTRIDKIIGTVQDTADTAIGSINKTASDAVDSIGKAEASINESVTVARGSADAAANSEQQAAASASAAQTSERNASNSAMQASQSATAAKQSETNAAESERNAASSAEQAANIVASVSGSVSQAEDAARSASQSATAAAGSASAAGGNAQAAAQSASDASASASAAKASETSAASSASAAKISETNAADSATAAQQAVDGFGLTVGSVTTGEPGTDAAVDITKTGAKYTANFTIPRGDIGPAGVNENVPLGSTSGVVAQATDAYPALPRKVQVHGRTIENFWKYKDGKNRDVNISIDDSGLIMFSSDTTAMNRYAVFFDFPDEYLEPGKYTIYNWSSDPNIRAGINAEFGGSDARIDGTSQCSANSSSTFEVISGRGYRFSVNLESRTVGKAFTSYVRVMIVKGENVLDEFTPSGITTAKPEKLVVHTNNFFPNIHGSTKNGITLTQDANGVYHMDGVSTINGRILWQVEASVPSGDYGFKHSASRSNIDGYINAVGSSQTTLQHSSAAGTKGSMTDFGSGFIFYIRCAGLQQGVEYHDTVQIVLASGTDIPSDFPKNESSEVALPSDLNLADGDTLVIDSDGSTQITHSSGEPTPSTPVTLPAIPAPTFAIYTKGGLTRPTVDVDYERNINIIINKLEQAIAVQAATMKVNQLTD